MRKELLMETLIVGGSVALMGTILSKTGMKTGTPLFWFTMGACTHLGWELSGGNRYYVETRRAEDLPKGFLVG